MHAGHVDGCPSLRPDLGTRKPTERLHSGFAFLNLSRWSPLSLRQSKDKASSFCRYRQLQQRMDGILIWASNKIYYIYILLTFSNPEAEAACD